MNLQTKTFIWLHFINCTFFLKMENHSAEVNSRKEKLLKKDDLDLHKGKVIKCTRVALTEAEILY